MKSRFGFSIWSGVILGTARIACGEPSLTVFAASSLRAPLEEIVHAWEELSGAPVRLGLDASGTLARQIEQGAPADVFVSAAEDWMDRLAGLGIVRSNSVRVLLGNRLVVVQPADAPDARVAVPADLARLRRIAIGDPATVPAGRYASAFLDRQPWRTGWGGRFVHAPSVAAALALVERGDVDAGIVYRTDALAGRRVRVGPAVDPREHPPIRYPAGVVARTTQPAAAAAFLAGLSSARSAAVFRRYGFEVLSIP